MREEGMRNMVEFKSKISCNFGQGKGVASVICCEKIYNSVFHRHKYIHGFAIIP